MKAKIFFLITGEFWITYGVILCSTVVRQLFDNCGTADRQLSNGCPTFVGQEKIADVNEKTSA